MQEKQCFCSTFAGFFNKYACVINKLNEMTMDGSDTLLKTAFLLKKVEITV